jgi:fatty acid desaturase
MNAPPVIPPPTENPALVRVFKDAPYIAPEDLREEPVVEQRGRYGPFNWLVLAAQTAAWAGLLTAIDVVTSWWSKAGLLLVFCLMMQGVFSLMHEAFHYNAHHTRRWNDLMGRLASILFVTSFTLHRIQHWGHHVRNRSVPEAGDFIYEGEKAWPKVFLYYFAIVGGLYAFSLTLPAAALVIPYRAVKWLAWGSEFNTYRQAFRQFRQQDWNAVRLEALSVAVFWSLIAWVGPWSLPTVLVAYAAFAFSWSSLQWVYHLRTPLHRTEGAYNLRLPTPVRWLFLNFNYNLTHHRRPDLPWQEIWRVSNHAETQPLWYRYVMQVLPPVRLPDDLTYLERRYF